ncbi:MAG: UDP-N-acetylmuramate dehydrogenase [Deltaproteobacteria bacterium]|nr:UDP-N-acetylmuramate dehydrogenase [Deltaproteobacteria bacterium]
MKEHALFHLELCRQLEEKNIVVKLNTDGSKLNNLCIGGVVSSLILARDLSELVFIQIILKDKFFVLGRGSNTFFYGDRINVPVVKLGSSFNKVVKISTNKFFVGAGVHIDSFARKVSLDGYSGLEFAVGIPGSFGGAIKMNAGAHSHEMSDIVDRVIFLKEGRIYSERPDFGYRSCGIPEASVIVGGEIRLVESCPQKTLQVVRNNLEYRRDTQPVNVPSLGSVFKNPPNHTAAQLIESVKLKGFKIGGCLFSSTHANWIVNPEKKGTYQDVESLVKLAKEQVRAKRGVILELEWVILKG